MSFTCNRCNAPISWDIKKREALNTKLPLNRSDLTIHKCYSGHTEENPKPVDLPIQQTKDVTTLVKPDFTEDEVATLKQFIAMLKLVGK